MINNATGKPRRTLGKPRSQVNFTAAKSPDQFQPKPGQHQVVKLQSNYQLFMSKVATEMLPCIYTCIPKPLTRRCSPPILYSSLIETLATIFNVDVDDLIQILISYTTDGNIRNTTISQTLATKQHGTEDLIRIAAAAFNVVIILHEPHHLSCVRIAYMSTGPLHHIQGQLMTHDSTLKHYSPLIFKSILPIVKSLATLKDTDAQPDDQSIEYKPLFPIMKKVDTILPSKPSTSSQIQTDSTDTINGKSTDGTNVNDVMDALANIYIPPDIAALPPLPDQPIIHDEIMNAEDLTFIPAPPQQFQSDDTASQEHPSTMKALSEMFTRRDDTILPPIPNKPVIIDYTPKQDSKPMSQLNTIPPIPAKRFTYDPTRSVQLNEIIRKVHINDPSSENSINHLISREREQATVFSAIKLPAQVDFSYIVNPNSQPRIIYSILSYYNTTTFGPSGWQMTTNLLQRGTAFPASMDMLSSVKSNIFQDFDIWSQLLTMMASQTDKVIHVNFPMVTENFFHYNISAPARLAISLLTGANVVVYNARVRTATLTRTTITQRTLMFYETTYDGIKPHTFPILPTLSIIHAFFQDENLLPSDPMQIVLSPIRTIFIEKHFNYDPVQTTITQYKYEHKTDLSWLLPLRSSFSNYNWKIIDETSLKVKPPPSRAIVSANIARQGSYFQSQHSKIYAKRRALQAPQSVMYINGTLINDQTNHIALPPFNYHMITLFASTQLEDSYYQSINYWIITYDSYLILLADFLDVTTLATNSSLRLYYIIDEDEISFAFSSGFSGLSLDALFELAEPILHHLQKDLLPMSLIEFFQNIQFQQIQTISLPSLQLEKYNQFFYPTSLRNRAAVLYRYRPHLPEHTVSTFDYLSYKILCETHELLEFVKIDHTIKLPCGALIDEDSVHMHTHQCILKQRAIKVTTEGYELLKIIMDRNLKCRYCNTYYLVVEDAKNCHN